MTTFLRRLRSRGWRPGQAAVAGLGATAAYSVAMETDKYLTGNRFDDVEFIQGMLNKRRAETKGASLAAWTLHFLNGVMLAEVYAAFGRRLLAGPAWLRGTLFGGAFILLVWPLTPLADRYHPLVKSGQLPRLANWTSFWQNLLRHLVFGLVLGLLYRGRTDGH